MNCELAWAAGFFDGEGWTTLNKQTKTSRKPRLHIGVAQKDRRPLERWERVFPDLGTIYKPGGTSNCFQWKATGPKAEAVLDQLWQFLSEPKREQAERVRAALGGDSDELPKHPA